MIKEERELRERIRDVGDRGTWNRYTQGRVTALIRAVREDERKLMATKVLKACHEAQAAMRAKEGE